MSKDLYKGKFIERPKADGPIYLINPPSVPECTSKAAGNVKFSYKHINIGFLNDFLNDNKLIIDNDILSDNQLTIIIKD